MNKLSLYIIMGIFLMVSVSALDWDNWRYEREITFDGKPIVGNELLQKYKPIEIKNAFGLGAIIFEGYISQHDERCGIDCKSTIEIKLHKRGVLINDVIFKTLQDGNWIEQPIRSYQFYVKTGEEEFSVDDYEKQCVETGKSLNGTKEIRCSQVKVGSHIEKRPLWIPYSLGEEMDGGIYTVKLEGKKKSSRTVDWIIETNGETLEEWATWGNQSLSSEGLMAYYAFDENTGTTSADATGNYNLTGTNTPGWTSSGKIGNATDLERDSSEYWSNESGDFSLNNTFSINLWIRLESYNNYAAAIDKARRTADGTSRFRINELVADGSIQVASQYGEGTLNPYTGDYLLATWYMITMVVNETGVAGYKDGVIFGYETNSTVHSEFTENNPLLIGSHHESGSPAYFWDGMIDEVSIWNRSLSADDVTALYNAGEGITYPLSEATVRLNSPVDGYVSPTENVTFNCSASVAGGATIKNMSLWTNETGDWGIRNSTTGLSGVSEVETWERTFTTAVVLWTCQGCDSDDDCGFATENRTLAADATNPTITLEYPTGTIDYGAVGENETLNVTFTDNNLNICWYNYNGTNITIDGCVSGVKNSTNFLLETADTNITLYANDTIGNMNTTSYDWDYIIFAQSETYSATTIETTEEEFIINITYGSSDWDSISARLYYNNTNYTGTQTGTGDSIAFDTSLFVPAAPSEGWNFTFYWIFSLTNATGTFEYESTPHNQTISQITFGLCGAGENPYVNFTTRSATNPFPIVNATFKSAWEIKGEGTSTDFLNKSFEDTTGANSSFAFCFSPNTSNYTVNAIIEIDAADFAKNFHYLDNVTYTNSTTNVSLYLLNDSLATLTEFEVVDGSQSPREEVYISIQFYDVGTDTFYTVGMMRTSSEGKDLTYLNWYDSLYRFIFVQDGTTIKSSTPYKISETPQIFEIVTATIFEFDKFEDFEYSLYFNETTNNFVLIFVKPSGDVESGCLRVIKRNQTNDYTICETCETSSSATVYCNIDGWGNGTFIGTFYATGSLKFIDMIAEVVGVVDEIYTLIGNENGTVMAIVFAGTVTGLFLVSPLMGIIGVILGALGAIAMGFQPMDYSIFIGLACVGGLVIWFLRK